MTRNAENHKLIGSAGLLTARNILDSAAPVAARIVADVVTGQIKASRINWQRWEAVKLCLAYHLGTPRRKVDIHSDQQVINYTQVIQLAEQKAKQQGVIIEASPALPGVRVPLIGYTVQDTQGLQWRVTDNTDPQAIKLHGYDTPMVSSKPVEQLTIVPDDVEDCPLDAQDRQQAALDSKEVSVDGGSQDLANRASQDKELSPGQPEQLPEGQK